MGWEMSKVQRNSNVQTPRRTRRRWLALLNVKRLRLKVLEGGIWINAPLSAFVRLFFEGV